MVSVLIGNRNYGLEYILHIWILGPLGFGLKGAPISLLWGSMYIL